MDFNRRSGHFLFLLPFILSCAFCRFTVPHRNNSITRTLFQNWRMKAKDRISQNARLFAKLPQDPESSYTPPQVISNRGYPVETHLVTTEDGYIITLHRIPPKSTPKKVVLLQHGVLESSGTWLVNPSSRSLAILLAEKGYDVWLGNARGNTYSKAHTRLDPKSAEYWQFSWDEIGNYDIPAFINYILQKTGESKLSYIGHSLGCGTFFMAMVKHPELNSKIEIMVALAPLSSFAHFKSFIRVFIPFYRQIRAVLNLLKVRGWLDSQGVGDVFFDLVCEQTYAQARFCRDALNVAVGPNRQNLDPTVIPAINNNILRGASVPVMAQFAQNYQEGEVFQAYDYGTEGNLQRYGSTYPYEYDLTTITAPIYVFSGGNDYVVAPTDVDWLLTKLRNLKGSTRISEYNHIDFIWGTDVKEKLYDQVIALLPSP